MSDNQTPVNENQTPVNENQTPVNENQTPVNENQTLVNENQTLVNENQTPVNENQHIDEGLAFKWQLLRKDPFSILYIKDATDKMKKYSLTKDRNILHFLENPSPAVRQFFNWYYGYS